MSDRKLTLIVGLFFAVTAVAAIVAVYMWRGGGPGRIAAIGGPYALVDHDGRSRTDADFRGGYALIYFGYTYCPDVCPTALSDMIVAIDELGPLGARIQPIFITIDPARDTPDRLKTYVPKFHPRLVGLSGSLAQITAVAKAYRVYFAKSKGPTAVEDYLMDHSSIIFLMDPDGRYVIHFNHGTGPEKMAERLRELLS